MSNSARFGSEIVSIGNVDLFRWRGGEGAPVLLLHGHTQTSDIWAQLADALVNMGRTVIAPDLHGLGRSSVPGSGYDKSSMARDFKTLIDKEGFADTPVTIVGHDLGVFAAYAYAAQFRDHVDRLILMDATVPGIGIWPVLLQQPRTWHFGFYALMPSAWLKGVNEFTWTAFGTSFRPHLMRLEKICARGTQLIISVQMV
ncbi:MAG: alpha/beta fold hydrolase [Pseudomonadota bacterium]